MLPRRRFQSVSISSSDISAEEVHLPLASLPLFCRISGAQQRCPAIGHVNNIENCTKSRIKYGDKCDLVSQIVPDSLPIQTIGIFGGFWRGVEIAIERSVLLLRWSSPCRIKIIANGKGHAPKS